MLRRLALVPAFLALSLLAGAALSQENPVLNKLLAKKIKEELGKLNSPETGYRDGAHWLHFDDPDKNLVVEVDAKKRGRLELSGSIKAKIAFNYRVEETKTILGKRVVLVRHDFGGHADATLSLDASAVPGEKLSDSKVKIKEIRVDNLRMRSDLANAFRGPIQDFVNGALRGKTPEFEKQLADALNTVKP